MRLHHYGFILKGNKANDGNEDVDLLSFSFLFVSDSRLISSALFFTVVFIVDTGLTAGSQFQSKVLNFHSSQITGNF
ncbi:hypothetical protein Gotur_019425 [Gossypium turneri]